MKATNLALATLFASGLLGWCAAISSFLWLTSHDSGDPDQYVGGLWFSAVVITFCGACGSSLIVALQRKSHPVAGLQWIPVAAGASYLLGIAGVVFFLLSD